MSLRISWLLLMAAFMLHADVIYSNFGVDDAYATGAGMLVTNDGEAWSSVAIEFVPADNYNLTGIEFVASDIFAGSPGISIGIFADNKGEPGGAPLESFNVTGPLGSFGSFVPVTTVTSLLQPLLLADTAYWVGIQGPAGGLVVWNQNVTGADGFSSTDGNGNWSASAFDQGVVEIDGTVAAVSLPAPVPFLTSSSQSLQSAPEPATIWLITGALVAMQGLRRRQRI